MKLKMAGLMVGIIFMMTMPAWAGNIDFNFSTGLNGAQGPQLTYTSDGLSITANGYQVKNGITTTDDLYVKTSGDESGLGLANGSGHEIGTSEFIQLNLTNLVNAGIFSGDLTIGGVQQGDGYSICTSSALGTLGTCTIDGTLDETAFEISWSAADPILGITAWVPTNGNPKSDVVAVSLSANTPQSLATEPASLVLMGIGLLGLAFAFRRHSKRSWAREATRPGQGHAKYRPGIQG